MTDEVECNFRYQTQQNPHARGKRKSEINAINKLNHARNKKEIKLGIPVFDWLSFNLKKRFDEPH